MRIYSPAAMAMAMNTVNTNECRMDPLWVEPEYNMTTLWKVPGVGREHNASYPTYRFPLYTVVYTVVYTHPV